MENQQDQEQQTKYFTENKYLEIAKSLNEFGKDTTSSGESINIGGIKQSEPTMISDTFSISEVKPNTGYGPVYYLNQIVDTHHVPSQTLSKLKEFQTTLNPPDDVFQKSYEGIIPDKADISPKEEIIKAQLTHLESKRKFETTLSSNLLDCVNSPETSPNLIPCSHEKYINPNDNHDEDETESTKSPKSNLVDISTSDNRSVNSQSQSKAIGHEYIPIHYNNPPPPQTESMGSNQGYYVPISYPQQMGVIRKSDEGDEGYMDFNSRKNTAYFNTVKLTYDENTKSYHPTIQMLEDGNNNFVYRPTILRTGMSSPISYRKLTDELTSSKVIPLFKYISENQNYSIDNQESYYARNSLKRDMMDDGRNVDMRNQRMGVNELIAGRDLKDKKTTRKGTGAGRPKLNRNHYSCSICQTKNTPQWRYHNGVAVCNACYMRMRKDRVYPYNSNKGKGKRSQL